MRINITSIAYIPEYNSTGIYRTTSKEVGSPNLYSVSVYSVCDMRKAGVPEMLIAWGFALKEEEIPPLTETILAACELIYANNKEQQHANV
jgi:hypothetical protein